MSRLTHAHPAVKLAMKARLAIAGPSGSGKTWTALMAAQELGEKVLLIDTEHESAALYADVYHFTHLNWDPPYDPRELAQTILEAGRSYDVVIVDSLSHFWMGEGGTLGIVDQAAARSHNNTYAGWREGTPAQQQMVEAIIRCPSHVIVTMRSKTEYVLEENDRGKKEPRKVGMAPVQRDGIEYEFTVTADLDLAHNLIVDKTRCPLLAGKMFPQGRTVDAVRTLAGWLAAGEALASEEEREALLMRMNALEPQERRMACKTQFVDEFGVVATLLASKVEAASAVIAEYETQVAEASAQASLEGAFGPMDNDSQPDHTPPEPVDAKATIGALRKQMERVK